MINLMKKYMCILLATCTVGNLLSVEEVTAAASRLHIAPDLAGLLKDHITQARLVLDSTDDDDLSGTTHPRDLFSHLIHAGYKELEEPLETLASYVYANLRLHEGDRQNIDTTCGATVFAIMNTCLGFYSAQLPVCEEIAPQLLQLNELAIENLRIGVIAFSLHFKYYRGDGVLNHPLFIKPETEAVDAQMRMVSSAKLVDREIKALELVAISEHYAANPHGGFPLRLQSIPSAIAAEMISRYEQHAGPENTRKATKALDPHKILAEAEKRASTLLDALKSYSMAVNKGEIDAYRDTAASSALKRSLRAVRELLRTSAVAASGTSHP